MLRSSRFRRIRRPVDAGNRRDRPPGHRPERSPTPIRDGRFFAVRRRPTRRRPSSRLPRSAQKHRSDSAPPAVRGQTSISGRRDPLRRIGPPCHRDSPSPPAPPRGHLGEYKKPTLPPSVSMNRRLSSIHFEEQRQRPGEDHAREAAPLQPLRGVVASGDVGPVRTGIKYSRSIKRPKSHAVFSNRCPARICRGLPSTQIGNISCTRRIPSYR